MRIVGVDPSYARTGIATTTDTRSLTPPTALADGHPLRRATRRRAWLRGQLAPLLRGADLIAIEGMYPSLEYGVLDRAALFGAIVDLVWTLTDAAILVVAPASVKIYATGNGNATKDAVHTAALALGSPARNDDEADSWVVASLAADLTGHPNLLLPPTLRRALDAYRPPFTSRHPDPWVRHIA